MILLTTKFLVPNKTIHHVKRPRLVKLIQSNIEYHPIMLIAPTGYGKSTLMADAINYLNYTTLWYQLDENDNDPSTFISYIIRGLVHVIPDFGFLVRDLIESTGPHPAERSLFILLNEMMAHPDYKIIIIFDDYHIITNPGVHQLMETLIENLLPNLRIIIAARTNPPLPLARWRARGNLLEIRTRQLGFSAEEADSLSKNFTDIPSSALDMLMDKTEGWGAGLQLMLNLTTTMSDSDDIHTLIHDLDGTHPYIFNYLMEEVFERQPLEYQEFLLHSAVLTQMNAGICRDVLEIQDAGKWLHNIDKENLFLLNLDHEKGWYRYHHLFRDFLLNRLSLHSPNMLKSIQIKAGNYYLAHKENEMAMHYFIKAGAFDEAMHTLKTFAQDWLDEGKVDTLHQYLSSLGEQLYDHPDLLYVDGKILRERGRFADANIRLQQVYEKTTEPHLKYTTLIELAGMARSQGDYRQSQHYATEALSIDGNTKAFALMELAKSEGFITGMDKGHQLAQQAIEEMRQPDISISLYQQAQLLRSLGQISWWHGDVNSSIKYCLEALKLLPEQHTPLVADILIILATPYLYRSEFDVALKHMEQALSICDRLQLSEKHPIAYAVIGNILTRKGEFKEAENYLQKAIDLAQKIGGASYAHVMGAGYLAYNLAAQGRLEEAQQLIETALWPHAGLPIVYEIYVAKSVLADIHLNSNNTADARKIFDDLIQIGEERQYHIPLAMAYFGRAYIAFEEKHLEIGLLYAERSIALLEPTQLWELYVDQGKRALLVCEELSKKQPDNAFIQQVKRALKKKYPEKHHGSSLVMQSPGIFVQTFGGLRVFHGDAEVDDKRWISAKARDLFALFISFRNKSLTLDYIIEELWGSYSATNTGAFHTALYRCRKALRTDNKDKEKYILVAMGDYRLDLAKFNIDVDEFDACIEQAKVAEAEQARAFYRQAITLYHGDYLQNLYYDWVEIEQSRLQTSYMAALRTLASLETGIKHYEEAITLLQKLLMLDPLHESVHREIMMNYHLLGDMQQVTRQYKLLSEILDDQMGILPSIKTQLYYEQIISPGNR